MRERIRPERQRRSLPLALAELRATRQAAREGALATLTGYAAVFGQWSEQLASWSSDGFREQIMPGAFARAIQEDDVRALWNHDESIVLGRSRAGTLRLAEDRHGLHAEIDLPDNEWGRPVLQAVERGDVTGMSFAFDVLQESWNWTPAGQPDERTLHAVRLFDVSPVTFPAYPDTEIDVLRSHAASLDLAGRALLLARAQAGLLAPAADHALIRTAITLLQRALPDGSGRPEGHASSAGARAPEPPACRLASAWLRLHQAD
jgi:HK97 family phage prohead protease